MKTITYIENLNENFIRISEKQERAIKQYFGNTISKEFSEQDIWEQTRKVINNA